MSDPLPEVLLERLRRAGLSRYESLVYLGLVQDRTARVAEIARRTGVPQPKVYQALDSLVEKGYCAVGADAVNRYRPVEPRLALEARSLSLESERAGILGLAEELDAIYRSGVDETRWAPPVEIVKGVAQIRDLLVDQVRNARSEILYFGQAPQMPAREVAQALWEKSESGIAMRLLFEHAYFDGPEARREEDELLKRMRGEKRWVDHLPSKMMIIDRSRALLSVAKAGSDGFFVLALRQEGLVEHCLASFDYHWERARTR